MDHIEQGIKFRDLVIATQQCRIFSKMVCTKVGFPRHITLTIIILGGVYIHILGIITPLLYINKYENLVLFISIFFCLWMRWHKYNPKIDDGRKAEFHESS